MYVERHIVLLIVIHPSVGYIKPGGPLGAFREEQAMSQHWVSLSPFLSSSSHTTQLHYTNSYTYSHPNLNFLQYTRQILVPHVMWSAQAVYDLKIDHTQRHLSALCGARSAYRYRHRFWHMSLIIWPSQWAIVLTVDSQPTLTLLIQETET